MPRLKGQADANLVPSEQSQPLDEAALIEERRKRREAIKSRHRGQATPLLAQALGADKALATHEHAAASSVSQGHNNGQYPFNPNACPPTDP